MLDLKTTGDVLAIAAIAAGVGAFASLTAELILARGKDHERGWIETPGGTGNRFVDLGSAAAIPIGVLAGVIAAFLFAPGEEVTVDNELVRQVELGELILISAVAGLSGTAFLAAMQDRFMAAIKTQKAETQIQSTLAGLMKIKETAKDTESAKKVGRATQDKVRRKLDETQKRTPPHVFDALRRANFTVGEETIELVNAPASEGELDDEAAEMIDQVADPATEALSDQVTRQVDLLLETLQPQTPDTR